MEINNLIKNAKNIAIFTHESPDGDAIGSSIATYLVLKKYDKNVDILIHDYPRIFDFLEETKYIKNEMEKEYDLAIVLDCANIQRVGYDISNIDNVINIDHHASNTYFGSINIVDDASPACCLLLSEILEENDIVIDNNMGNALVTGILTDTGGLCFNNIPKTYDFVSNMLRSGIDVTNIYHKVIAINTKAQFELKKLAMDRLEFIHDKIAFTYINSEDEQRLGTKSGDHEGIVDIGRNIENIEVSVLLREVDNKYRVSLRSNSYVDVSIIAAYFGGGGHRRASGFVMEKEFLTLKNEIIDKIIEVL